VPGVDHVHKQPRTPRQCWARAKLSQPGVIADTILIVLALTIQFFGLRYE